MEIKKYQDDRDQLLCLYIIFLLLPYNKKRCYWLSSAIVVVESYNADDRDVILFQGPQVKTWYNNHIFVAINYYEVTVAVDFPTKMLWTQPSNKMVPKAAAAHSHFASKMCAGSKAAAYLLHCTAGLYYTHWPTHKKQSGTNKEMLMNSYFRS